jgi:hypothetical protein
MDAVVRAHNGEELGAAALTHVRPWPAEAWKTTRSSGRLAAVYASDRSQYFCSFHNTALSMSTSS